jgi:phosphate transport system permease protein
MAQVVDSSTYGVSRAQLIASAIGRSETAELTLARQARPVEDIIRILLFIAGVFSILTTFFIVIYLGSEALTFFNSRTWIQAKTTIVAPETEPIALDPDVLVTPTSNTLLLDIQPGSRIPFIPGQYVQVGDEIMRVTERRERSIVVERGQLGTQAIAHEANESVYMMSDAPVRVTNELGTDGTEIVVGEGYGGQFSAGQIIHLDQETLRISAVEGDTLTVERGIEGTLPRNHEADGVIEVERKPTLLTYLTGTRWQPTTGDFGVLPLVTATLVTTFFAIIVALPTGLAAAIYLSEYASPRVRNTLNPILELLVGVPTVVYGFFALQFVTQGVLQPLFGSENVNIYNTLSAGIVVGIMIIPTIASMSLDAMTSVPRALREASYGLGATKLETTIQVVLPAALSGIIAAIILGISRAVGETMIVAIAAGAGPNLTLNPFVGAETMTGHIARISGGDLSYASIDYTSIFVIGMTLFIITFFLTQISTMITRRFREAY